MKKPNRGEEACTPPVIHHGINLDTLFHAIRHLEEPESDPAVGWEKLEKMLDQTVLKTNLTTLSFL